MSSTGWRCPTCGRPAFGPGDLCSGSFLDADHPANVRPVQPQLGPIARREMPPGRRDDGLPCPACGRPTRLVRPGAQGVPTGGVYWCAPCAAYFDGDMRRAGR